MLLLEAISYLVVWFVEGNGPKNSILDNSKKVKLCQCNSNYVNSCSSTSFGDLCWKQLDVFLNYLMC